MPHIFATRRGRKLREEALARDNWICQMCGVLLREGRKHREAAIVDHTIPVSLAPELENDLENLRSVCRDCHAVCASIEARHDGNAQAIRDAKLRGTVIGVDGWPI